MTQPVRKISILMGRFFAAVLLGFLLIMIEYAGVAALSQDFYGTVSAGILLSIIEALFLIASFTAVAFLFSSIFKNPLIGILFSVIVFILVFGIVQAILEITNIEPWFILNYGGEVVTEIRCHSLSWAERRWKNNHIQDDDWPYQTILRKCENRRVRYCDRKGEDSFKYRCPH